MLKILEKQQKMTSEEASKQYPKCNYILTDVEVINGITKGIVYAISEEPSTLAELNTLEDKLKKEGKSTLIAGDYYPDCIFDYLKIEED